MAGATMSSAAGSAVLRAGSQGVGARGLDDGFESDCSETFAECLNRFRERAGLSVRQLAAQSYLTNPFVSRLVNWDVDLLNPRLDYRRQREERHPSRDTVIRLAMAMNLSVIEADELIMSAGYVPLVR
jgi:hypothetical protein